MKDALENVRFSKSEIQRIIKAPYGSLSKREIGVRKLLARFHDDTEAARRSESAKSIFMELNILPKLIFILYYCIKFCFFIADTYFREI